MSNRTNIHKADMLSRIVAAVETGERAPFNSDVTRGAEMVARLVAEGKIRVEIYSMNYRVIRLHDSGKQTMACPHPNNGPYKILDGKYDYDAIHSGGEGPTPAQREDAAAAGLKGYHD